MISQDSAFTLCWQSCSNLLVQIHSTEKPDQPVPNPALRTARPSNLKLSRASGKKLGVDLEDIQTDVPFDDGPHGSAQHRSSARRAVTLQAPASKSVNSPSDDESGSSGGEQLDLSGVTELLQKATEPPPQRGKPPSLNKSQAQKGFYNDELDWTYDAIYAVDSLGSELDADVVHWEEVLNSKKKGRRTWLECPAF